MPESRTTVRPTGRFHGLPTFPCSQIGLAALITGANGISGFHMVKALAAAPDRRSKISCLWRRPPPDYFWAVLPADSSTRVQHICVNFLNAPNGDPSGGPDAVAAKLPDHVDHVLFFSYAQPSQKGGIGGMRSDADALSDPNTRLLRNFLDALRIAKLRPKRIML
jgi:nucleoside-diphosphate-sugar epimerase